MNRRRIRIPNQPSAGARPERLSHERGGNRRLAVPAGVALLALMMIAAPAVIPAQTTIAMTPDTFVADAVGARDVEISPFGTFVAIYDQTEGNAIRLFDSELRQLWRRRLPYYWAGSLDPGSVIQFAPDESFLIFPGGRTENDICVCDPESGDSITVLRGHENSVDDLGLSPNGHWLVSSSYDEIILWEREGETFTARQIISDFAPATHSIEFLGDSERVAISNSNQMLRSITVYRVTSGRLVQEFRHQFTDNNISNEIDQLAISPDGRWLAAGYRDTVLFFGVTATELQEAGRITEIDVGNVTTLTWSPDGTYLVTGHHRFIKWWRQSGSDWEEVATVPTQMPVLHDVEMSADGRWLYAASRADENALARFAVDGVGSSPLGSVTNTLGRALSVAQRRVLTPSLARDIVAAVGPQSLGPRDMFETEDEYEARITETRGRILTGILDAVEARYGAERVANDAAEYDVLVPLQSQGTYDIDRQRYGLTTMDEEGWLQLDRNAARSLYQEWQLARMRATRFARDGVPGYADFRIDHPDGVHQYPFVLEQNPFTGERLNTAGNLIPVIAAGRDLVIRDLELDGIFPTLYAHYSSEPFGRFIVENTGTGIVSELSISFSIEGLTGGSHRVALPASLAAGRTATGELTAPIAASVLDISEGDSATLTMSVSYRRGDEEQTEEISRQIRVLNRNAIQWTDDHRIGAFMTVSNPDVLAWAGRAAASAEMSPTPALPRNLLYAIQLYESLPAAGIDYVIDPNSAYETLSADNRAVDFLRFPTETLVQGAGDCDDLSVLYATLLEAVGVPSAFITTPGHIFVAFDTGLTEEEARSTFDGPENLILVNGAAWMPVETTILEEGFVRAWQIAALQWRQGAEAGAAGFFTAQDAWSRYSPVTPPLTASTPEPSVERTNSAVRRQLEVYRTVELEPKLRRLAEDSRGTATPAAQNQRGVLYAMYGLLEQASEQFELALGASEYVPALINQANVLSVRGLHEEARRYLERARAVDPDNPRVLMGLAFSYWESGDQVAARDSYAVASEASPSLARRFPLFSTASSGESARAGVGPSIFSKDWAGEE